jgi:hypothetical protein
MLIIFFDIEGIQGFRLMQHWFEYFIQLDGNPEPDLVYTTMQKTNFKIKYRGQVNVVKDN